MPFTRGRYGVSNVRPAPRSASRASCRRSPGSDPPMRPRDGLSSPCRWPAPNSVASIGKTRSGGRGNRRRRQRTARRGDAGKFMLADAPYHLSRAGAPHPARQRAPTSSRRGEVEYATTQRFPLWLRCVGLCCAADIDVLASARFSWGFRLVATPPSEIRCPPLISRACSVLADGIGPAEFPTSQPRRGKRRTDRIRHGGPLRDGLVRAGA